MRQRTLALGTAALAVALPAVLLVPDPASTATTAAPPSAAGDPTVATLTAEVQVRGDGGATDVTVTVEAARGRIEVSPYYWRSDESGRYLHVVVGHAEGDACAAERWVVVDTTDPASSKVYDVANAPVPETVQFTVPPRWAEHVGRVGVAPFAEVDCARAASFDSPDRVDHGPRVWGSPSYDLEPVSQRGGAFPLSAACPRSTRWGDLFPIEIRVSNAPGAYPPAGVVPHPSVFPSGGLQVDPGPFTVVSVPDVPTDLDTWTSPAWTGELILDPDDSQVVRVLVGGDLVLDGQPYYFRCRARVLMPVPTDWVGTLAGEKWWDWEYVSNSGLGSHLLHHTYEFLDDEWVFVSEEYGGRRTEPCTSVARRMPWGCHRYYYDEASQRLQIDDRRARRDPERGYWSMPAAPKYSSFSPQSTILPVRTGQRLRYHGTSRDGELWLRKTGTYRYEGPHPDTGRNVTWSGTYRFVGGRAQELVLDHGRRAFRDEVQLYYAEYGDEGLTLYDLDTHHRRMRFQLR